MTYREERMQRRKALSATEKLNKVQELKAKGYTQIRTAKEIGCSLKTVVLYWHNTNTISKQECLRKSIVDRVDAK